MNLRTAKYWPMPQARDWNGLSDTRRCFKDILKCGDLKRPELLDRIASALAFQIGQEVSYSELAQTCGTDDKTVSRYIDILEADSGEA